MLHVTLQKINRHYLGRRGVSEDILEFPRAHEALRKVAKSSET
jgi:hypothetical protein